LGQCYEAQEDSTAAQGEYKQVVAAGYEEAIFTATARQRLSSLAANLSNVRPVEQEYIWQQV